MCGIAGLWNPDDPDLSRDIVERMTNAISHRGPDDSGLYVGNSWLEYQDLRARTPSLPNLIAARMVPLYVGEPGAGVDSFTIATASGYSAGGVLKGGNVQVR